jgi:hypothetical protein
MVTRLTVKNSSINCDWEEDDPVSAALYGTREHIYLEVGEPRQIESWNYMKCGPCSQQQLKLMDGMFVVATETQTPYLEQSFQVQEDCKCNLKQK